MYKLNSQTLTQSGALALFPGVSFSGGLGQHNCVDFGLEWYEPPYVEPEPFIPTQVSMRQARLILLQYGLLDAVNATVSTFPQAAQIEWEYASVVERSNPLIGMIGLTEAQLDEMFTAAALL